MSILRIPAFRRQRDSLRSMVEPRLEILAVTPDDRLYSSLLYVATQHGWVTRWTKSVDGAIRILKSGTDAILLYDWYSASQSWQDVTGRLLGADSACCIVLAAPHVDEDLWEQAVVSRVYDVVPRTGPAGHMAATLRFAWQHKVRRLTAERTPDALKLRSRASDVRLFAL